MSFVCPKCNKEFNHKSGLSRHLHGSVKYGLKPCKADEMKTKNTLLEQQVAELTQLVAELKAQKESQICHIPQEETQENDRILHSFDHSGYRGVGSPTPYPLPFVTAEEVIEIIKKTKPYKVYGTLLRLFHFNDQHPEYWNICIRNKSHGSKISYWDGAEWMDVKLVEFVENVTRKIRTMIENLGFDFDPAFDEVCGEISKLLETDDDNTKTPPYEYVRSVLLDDEILSKVRKYHGFKSK